MLETWQPQIACAGSFEMQRAVKALHGLESLPLGDFAS